VQSVVERMKGSEEGTFEKYTEVFKFSDRYSNGGYAKKINKYPSLKGLLGLAIR
jgi:hypothetical protein